MAIETDKVTFAAPPKAGCRFTYACLREIGGVKGRRTSLHIPWKVEGKPLISIVRDPADWLRSYYQNIHEPLGLKELDAFQRFRNGKHKKDEAGFRDYVEEYLKSEPGEIGRMFAAYGPDIAWRIEDMPYPLEEYFGVKVAYHNREETKHKFNVPHELRLAIRKHEEEFVDKWRY